MPIHENAMSSAFSPLEHSGEDTSGDRNYKGSINDMYGDIEEWCGHAEKKRRLSFDQVRRMENKVEPERKMQLAKELGLQPRQVAVWFQNRRARWKTKQLEKDYDALKFNYVNLKSNYEEIQKQKEQLSSELEILKRKFVEDKRCKENSIDDTESGKNETYGLFSSENSTSALKGVRSEDINFRPVSGVVCFSKRAGLFPSSHSDSSTIVNQDRSSYCPLTTGLNWDAQTSNLKIVLANTAADCRPDHGEMQFSEGTVCCKGIPPLESQQLLILDEGILHNEGCNLFTNVVEDQSTTLPWWGWP